MPSVSICSSPASIRAANPPDVKVPTNTTFFEFWEILMKPPHPETLEEKRLALTLPAPSHSANPRHAISRPPPSMKSNCEVWSMEAVKFRDAPKP